MAAAKGSGTDNGPMSWPYSLPQPQSQPVGSNSTVMLQEGASGASQPMPPSNGDNKQPRKAWHTVEDGSIRNSMIERIVGLLQQRRPNATPVWQEKIPHMAKRLESELYIQAETLAEYSDPYTLKNRLEQLAMSMGNKLAAKQPGGVMIPSPDASPATHSSQDPLVSPTHESILSNERTHSAFLFDLSRFVVRLVEDPPTSGGTAADVDRWLMPYGIFFRPDGDEEEVVDGQNQAESKACASKDELARDAFLTQVHTYIITRNTLACVHMYVRTIIYT